MVVLNGVSRYHLCMMAMQRVPRLQHLTSPLIQECDAMLARHYDYVRTHFEDMPEVRDWVWTD
jgi:xylulose-5-phosphate/fructose-6-phosphate phosphoketolase